MQDFKVLSKLFKVLCQPIRLQIINMLSCEVMCACDLLEVLSISQPTLSHHMKVLIESELVKGEKNATWMYYSINLSSFNNLHKLIDAVTIQKADCICHTIIDKRKNCK